MYDALIIYYLKSKKLPKLIKLPLDHFIFSCDPILRRKYEKIINVRLKCD